MRSVKGDVAKALHGLLGPLGFDRSKATWSRRHGSLVELIELQIDKSGALMSVNAAVVDLDVHATIWGTEPIAAIQEASGTARATLSELSRGQCAFWDLHQELDVTAVAAAVSDHVLPFLARLDSREALAQWLSDAKAMDSRYPLDVLHWAVLQHLLGRRHAACDMLAALRAKKIGAWVQRTADVSQRLGCS
jgi:hypothetical protein